MHPTTPPRRRARHVLVAVGSLVLATGALSMPTSLADTQVDVDGDLADVASGDISFGSEPGDRSCDTLGDPVTGQLKVRYNGSDHFAPGEQVRLEVVKPAAFAFSQTGTTSISDPWTGRSADVAVPFSVTVPVGTADGSYPVRVTARGATTGYVTPNSPSSFSVVVDCPAVNTPPAVGEVQGAATVSEGSSATYGVTASDPDGDLLGYEWSIVSGDATFTGPTDGADVEVAFRDGPGSVSLRVAVDDGHNDPVVRTLLVGQHNVAPTISSVTASADSVLVGHPVTFAGSATDPSPVDTTAGFAWSFEDGTFGPSTFTTTLSTCGEHTVSAVARDKDGGVSTPVVSEPVTAYDAKFLSPLREGAYNKVQKGQVVPVKLHLGCAGVFTGGLAPSIQLLGGDVDAATDPGDSSIDVTTESVSAADTTGVMREVDGQYLYNLRVPSTSTVGQKYTVRVRPFGTSGGARYVVLEVRK
jgi:hypothetical protein